MTRTKSTKQQRMEYLHSTRTQWFINNQVDETAVTQVAKDMRTNGLFGQTTPVEHIRFSIRNLISQLTRGPEFRGM